MSLAATEQSKYEKVWQVPEYRLFSPGEQMLPLFRQMVRPRRKGTLIDIGCGTGRASQALTNAGWQVTQMDFADNARDSQMLPFLHANIWEPWPTSSHWDQGYCCDVMEHLPPVYVNAALTNIFQHCHRVFFSIHFGPDNFGKTIGHPLHLTIQPFTWWRDKLREFGVLRNARDLLGVGAFDVEGIGHA